MAVKIDDFDKYTDLVALLDDWKAAAALIGVSLSSVSIQLDGLYTGNQIVWDEVDVPGGAWLIQ